MRSAANQRWVDGGGLPAKPRVLIAEPDRDVRELIATYLHRLDCEPVVATSSEGGVPDVDLIVAEPASLSSQRLFAAHTRSDSRIPIVCISILPRERAETAGCSAAYVAKPFSEFDLRRAVRTALSAPG